MVTQLSVFVFLPLEPHESISTLYTVNIIPKISIISDKKRRVFTSQTAAQCRHASCSLGYAGLAGQFC